MDEQMKKDARLKELRECQRSFYGSTEYYDIERWKFDNFREIQPPEVGGCIINLGNFAKEASSNTSAVPVGPTPPPPPPPPPNPPT